MLDSFAPWGRLFGALAIDAALIVAATFVLQRFVRTAAWRRTFWQVAFLGLGFVSVAEIGGIKQVAMFANPAEPKQSSSAQLVFQVSTNDSPDLTSLATELRWTSPNSLVRASAPDARVQPLAWWPGWIWLLGCTAVAVWMATARLIFVCCVRRDPVGDETIVKRAHTLACRLGLRRRVAVTETPGLAGPIAFGVLRPGISLPEGFGQRFSATQQEAMLAHELAHLAARDPLWLALADALAVLFWWHPLVWVARRQLRAASEAAADEASLLVENGPAALAECLVELGGRLTQTRSLAWLGMEGGEFRSGLGRRVKRLVTMPSQQWRPIRRTSDWLVKTLGVTTVVIVALAATAWLQPREARSDSFSQAFRESVIGLALIAAFPEPQTENVPTEPIVDFERIDWKPWSRAAVAAARADGRPVLVNFTADWAVTAQVNEKTGLDVPVVRAKLREIGAVALRGDYTVISDEITSELQSFGRAGVPLVLVYTADSSTPPKVLPPVLTPEIVLDALDQAVPSAAANVIAPSKANAAQEKNRVTGILFEGKALYDSGRVSEAEAKWRDALRLDPQNPATKHYLSLLQNVRPASDLKAAQKKNRVPGLFEGKTFYYFGAGWTATDGSREALNHKLDSIRLEEVTFDGRPLSEVLKKLGELIKARDPEKRGVNFILFDEVSQTTIDLLPSLKDITARHTLDAIISTSSTPLKYDVESYAVVISPAGTPVEALHTRWFKIDPQATGGALRELLGTNATSLKASSNSEALLTDLRYFLRITGVDLVPPKRMLMNERLGQLMVRATLVDLDAVESALQVFNASPPQLTVEVRLCEFTEEAARELSQDPVLGKGVLGSVSGAIRASTTNESEQTFQAISEKTFQAILTSEQYHAALRALEGRPGVDVLTVPKVTTLSGRQAQIKSVNVRYIVTDLDIDNEQSRALEAEAKSKKGNQGVTTGGGAQNETTTFQPLAEPFELGPVVDLVPYVGADGLTISMTVITTIKEFVGYENLEGLVASVKVGQHAPVTQVVPLPSFRLRQLVASAKVLDGQTVVLAGGASNVERRGFTGNAVAGPGQNERATSAKKSLLVFVTPTLIDPAGNRVH